MAERLVARGAKAERVKVVHNWADGDRVKPVAPADNRFLRQHGLEGKFVVGWPVSGTYILGWPVSGTYILHLRERGHTAGRPVIFVGPSNAQGAASSS